MGMKDMKLSDAIRKRIKYYLKTQEMKIKAHSCSDACVFYDPLNGSLYSSIDIWSYIMSSCN